MGTPMGRRRPWPRAAGPCPGTAGVARGRHRASVRPGRLARSPRAAALWRRLPAPGTAASQRYRATSHARAGGPGMAGGPLYRRQPGRPCGGPGRCWPGRPAPAPQACGLRAVAAVPVARHQPPALATPGRGLVARAGAACLGQCQQHVRARPASHSPTGLRPGGVAAVPEARLPAGGPATAYRRLPGLARSACRACAGQAGQPQPHRPAA